MENDVCVDVILPIYKEPKEYLILSIESILKQTYKNIILYLAIDYSNNVEAIELAKKYNLIDKRVKYFVNEKNLGIVENLNKAISISNSPVIARMDADDISTSDRIEKQILFMREHNLDFVGANVKFFKNKAYWKTNLPNEDLDIRKYSKVTNCFYHPTFMFKRNVLGKCGCYKNIPYAEDYLFSVNLINNGFKVGNCPEALLYYRSNPEGISQKNAVDQFISAYFIQNNFKSGHTSFDSKEFDSFLQQKNIIRLKRRFADFINKLNKGKESSKLKKAYINVLLLIKHPIIFYKKVLLKTKYSRKTNINEDIVL